MKHMKREPAAQTRFLRSAHPAANPYIGFTSYQRFRNDPLFADVVVRPENNKTETEASECYPTSPDVEQKGKGEGFYPDTEVAYIRILWKAFEPVRGTYNYGLIEDILKKAEQNRQTVMLRLMPHSTRACDDVPDWLKKEIPCPERPVGMRVKDSPEDPVFLQRFGDESARRKDPPARRRGPRGAEPAGPGPALRAKPPGICPRGRSGRPKCPRKAPASGPLPGPREARC